MDEHISLQAQPERTRVAFYGTLFSIAAADGIIDRDENRLIFESMDIDGLTEKARHIIHGYIIKPPKLKSCLNKLIDAPSEIRYGLMISIMEVAQADDDLDKREIKLIKMAQISLDITNDQMQAINHYLIKIREVKERGIDDNKASDTVKSALSILTGAGIPIAAVYFSGSVVGLSAAGITSGLAALGLGLGMVPGIGIAILIGTVTVIGLSKILDIGGKRKKETLASERERKAQLVIKNLQDFINIIIDHVNTLKKSASDSTANKEAIEVLTNRLKALQQTLSNRKHAMGSNNA